MALPDNLVSLPVDQPFWDRFFTVAPLVVVGTLEEGGAHDLAPKHMVTPLSWQGWFGFVCTPRHRTWVNLVRTGVFTASWLKPDQVLNAALTSAPREDDESKPALAGVPVFPAQVVHGVLVSGAYLHLECRVERVLDGLGPNGLVIGKVVAVHVDRSALRDPDRDDGELLADNPLLVYVPPNRFAVVEHTHALPLHAGFRK